MSKWILAALAVVSLSATADVRDFEGTYTNVGRQDRFRAELAPSGRELIFRDLQLQLDYTIPLNGAQASLPPALFGDRPDNGQVDFRQVTYTGRLYPAGWNEEVQDYFASETLRLVFRGKFRFWENAPQAEMEVAFDLVPTVSNGRVSSVRLEPASIKLIDAGSLGDGFKKGFNTACNLLASAIRSMGEVVLWGVQ